MFSLFVVKARCKRMQHCWPTTPNIVKCYMLCPLHVVVQSLKLVKLLATCKRTEQLPTMLHLFAPGVTQTHQQPGF